MIDLSTVILNYLKRILFLVLMLCSAVTWAAPKRCTPFLPNNDEKNPSQIRQKKVPALVRLLYEADTFKGSNSAQYKKKIEQARRLINKGELLTLEDELGCSALAVASQNGELEIVKAILEKAEKSKPYSLDPDTYVRGLFGSKMNPAELALEQGHHQVVNFLKEIFILTPSTSDSEDVLSPNAISNILKTGDVPALKKFLDKGLDPNIIFGDHGITLFEYAIAYAPLPIITFLLDKKVHADLDHQNDFGFSSLHFAVERSDFIILRALLEAGANPNLLSEGGNSPLMRAVLMDKPELVQILAEKKYKANLEFLSKTGFAALHAAAQNEKVLILKILLDAGANVNVRKDSGATPLISASNVGNLAEVQILLDPKYKVDLNAVDNNGASALLHALGLGHLEIAKALLDAGADINCLTLGGNTPLILAAQLENTDALRLLLDPRYPLKLDLNGKKGTALLHAVGLKRSESVALLLKAGADPYLADRNGNNPFLASVDPERKNILKAFLDHNHELELTGKKNPSTPYNYSMALGAASTFEDASVLKMLLDLGDWQNSDAVPAAFVNAVTSNRINNATLFLDKDFGLLKVSLKVLNYQQTRGEVHPRLQAGGYDSIERGSIGMKLLSFSLSYLSEKLPKESNPQEELQVFFESLNQYLGSSHPQLKLELAKEAEKLNEGSNKNIWMDQLLLKLYDEIHQEDPHLNLGSYAHTILLKKKISQYSIMQQQVSKNFSEGAMSSKVDEIFEHLYRSENPENYRVVEGNTLLRSPILKILGDKIIFDFLKVPLVQTKRDFENLLFLAKVDSHTELGTHSEMKAAQIKLAEALADLYSRTSDPEAAEMFDEFYKKTLLKKENLPASLHSKVVKFKLKNCKPEKLKSKREKELASILAHWNQSDRLDEDGVREEFKKCYGYELPNTPQEHALICNNLDLKKEIEALSEAGCESQKECQLLRERIERLEAQCRLKDQRIRELEPRENLRPERCTPESQTTGPLASSSLMSLVQVTSTPQNLKEEKSSQNFNQKKSVQEETSVNLGFLSPKEIEVYHRLNEAIETGQDITPFIDYRGKFSSEKKAIFHGHLKTPTDRVIVVAWCKKDGEVRILKVDKHPGSNHEYDVWKRGLSDKCQNGNFTRWKKPS